jgi:hypothetical protein
VTEDTFSIFNLPVIWEWDFLGDGSLILSITTKVHWFKRLTTKLVFGSKWKKSSNKDVLK